MMENMWCGILNMGARIARIHVCNIVTPVVVGRCCFHICYRRCRLTHLRYISRQSLSYRKDERDILTVRVYYLLMRFPWCYIRAFVSIDLVNIVAPVVVSWYGFYHVFSVLFVIHLLHVTEWREMQPRACSFFFLLFPHVVLFSFYCPRRANGRPVGAVRLTLPSSALIITIVLCCAVTFRLHTRVLLLHIHICLSVVYNRPFIVLHASSIYPVNYLTLQYYYIIYNRVAIYISAFYRLYVHPSLRQ